MQINGRPIEDESLAELVTEIRPLADAMEDHPTEFELMTAAALLWFKQQRCDIVVLEVGLGGRLDATNVIDAPEAAVIMNIGLDHTEILGDTLEKIAAEKAGIFKPGCEAAALSAAGERDEAVVAQKAASPAPAGIRQPGGAELLLSGASPMPSRCWAAISCATPPWCWRPWRSCAAGAGSWSRTDVEHGLYATSWPARFELVSEEPPFIVDGGHNPQCAETVRDNLLHYFPEQKPGAAGGRAGGQGLSRPL